MDTALERRGALVDKLIRLHERMCEGLLEREVPAALLLLAALSGEHVLLVGPPGTAKSELARRLKGSVPEGGYFERLLTRFSVPEELFGPLSIKALERDEYRRLTAGYLPTAKVAFLDEIFNANSAILNALLTLLNEREFDDGAGRVKAPLLCVVAASNQVPEAAELEALHDRFLIRYEVSPVSEPAFAELVWGGAPGRGEGAEGERLTDDEIEAVSRGASSVRVSQGAVELVASLRRLLADKGVQASDRRWRQLGRLLRVSAHADGRDEVSVVDCMLLAHGLWSRPEQRASVEEALQKALDVMLVDEPKRFGAMTTSLELQIEIEAGLSELSCDEQGRPFFLDEAGQLTTVPHCTEQAVNADREPLFIAPGPIFGKEIKPGYSIKEIWEGWFRQQPSGLEGLEAWVDDPGHRCMKRGARRPVTRPARFSREHIDGRREQLNALQRDAGAYLASLEGWRGRALSPWLRGPDATVRARIDEAMRVVTDVDARLARAIEAVDALPVRPS